MKIKAPFVIQTTPSKRDRDWGFVQGGYTVRQFLSFVRPIGRRRRWLRWWVWGYVQSEYRLLNQKELDL